MLEVNNRERERERERERDGGRERETERGREGESERERGYFEVLYITKRKHDDTFHYPKFFDSWGNFNKFCRFMHDIVFYPMTA